MFENKKEKRGELEKLKNTTGEGEGDSRTNEATCPLINDIRSCVNLSRDLEEHIFKADSEHLPISEQVPSWSSGQDLSLSPTRPGFDPRTGNSSFATVERAL